MANIDWDAFERDVDEAARQARQETDDKLAEKISKVTRLTDEEIKQLFPDPSDTQRVARLLRIVRGATDHNQKVLELQKNISEVGGVVVKVLDRLI